MNTWVLDVGRRVNPDGLSFGAADPAGPYDRALRAGTREIFLYDTSMPDETETVPVWRYAARADPVDRSLVQRARGSVLDVGCGPGRILKQSILAGYTSLGVDVSVAAIDIAAAAGLPVLQRSVFDPLPAEGTWGTVFLLDGNVGIGGDPVTLLARIRTLLADDGRVLVETCADSTADRSFSAVLGDAAGHRSEPFPWTRLGSYGLRRHALRAGLRLTREWSAGARCFAEYATPGRA
jgi:SAM-dependent methyltransferase